jgi:hypothetical protein
MAIMTPTNLVAITPGGVITDEHIAGFYFWYSIEELSQPLAKVRRAFRENGLDEERLPTERRPEHRMQEACKSVEGVTSNGHREEVRAQQVDRTGGHLIYQVTRYVQHKESRTIEFPKALRVTFSFDTGDLTFEPLENATQADVQGLIDQISAHFGQSGEQMPGRKLRTIVRHYVEEAGAENMRGTSGGVYFMAKENPLPAWSKLHAYHGDLIEGGEFIQRVRMMLEDIYGTAPNFNVIPCINEEGQREFLRRVFIENCSKDLGLFRDECLDLIKGKDKRERAFRQDKLTAMVQQRKEMDMRRQKFAAILGETLDELDANMKLADSALSQFLQEAGA